MKKLCVFLASVVFVGINFLQAQNVQITGTVTSAEDGEPLIGATIQAKGTGIGVATDFDGKYSISVPASATVLEFRSIGMKSQDVEIAGRTVINVVLEPDMEELEEVIVVGYGSAKKVGTVVGSVAKVGTEKIASRPQASVLEAIQGQVAGLQVFTSSGDPGEIQSIRLHGVGSLGASSTPLYVLDGIAVSATTFRSLNPNDIESVTVLKDASATSIYGSRAANGVIYITTKRGSSTRMQVNVRSQYGVSGMGFTRFYDNMMDSEQLIDFWKDTGIKTQAQIDNLMQSLENEGQLKADGSLYNTDWRKYNQPDNRATYQGDVSILGGSAGTQYHLSASIYNEEGSTPGSFFDRYTLASNIDSRVKDWLKVGANFRLSLSERMINDNWGNNYLAGGLSFLLQPFYSPYDQDGNEYDYIPGLGQYSQYYATQKRKSIYSYYGGIASGYVEIEPIKNLKIRTTPGIDALGISREAYRLPSYAGALGEGYLLNSTQEQYTATISNTIEYSFELNEKNDFVVLLGHEGIKSNTDFFYATSDMITDDRLMLLQNGDQSTYEIGTDGTAHAFLSFFARADYSFDRKYFFDASVRQDQSSRFGKNNRTANFWAVGAMWNMKNEDFLKDIENINQMNIKVSYGTQGNASIQDFESLAEIRSTVDYAHGDAWHVYDPGNPDLQWETQKKLTAGVTARFFNRLNAGVEFYRRTTANMLMTIPVVTTSGFDEAVINVGALQNQGVDVSLGIDILRGRDYFLGFNTVFNYNAEKITELFDGNQRWTIANTGVAWVVGKPVMFYYPLHAGINPDTGRGLWYLPDPDGDIDRVTRDPDRVTETFNEGDLLQNTGIRRYAPINGGFGLSGMWRGFGLNLDFAYSLGKYLISNDRYFSENPVKFGDYNTSIFVEDYWKEPGDKAEFPDWRQGLETQFDDRFIEDASFMRLKNLTLSYTLPENVIGRTNFIHGLRVYFTGRNVFTVVNKDFRGIDPEVDSNLTLGRVANTRQFVFGLDFTF